MKCEKNPAAKCAETTRTSSIVKHPSVGVAVTLLTSALWKYASATARSALGSAHKRKSFEASACRCSVWDTEKPASRAKSAVLTRKSSLAPFRRSVVGSSISSSSASAAAAASGSAPCAL